jgi:hypothetical protein
MRQLFSDREFNEKLNKKYEIMAQKANQPASGIDYGDPEQRQFLKDEAHWADIRKRNTALELQDKINSGALGLQGLKNTGSLETEKTKNAGSIARQKLASELGLEGTKYTADQHLTGEKYKSDMLGESAKNSGLSELLKAHSGVLNDPMAAPERKAESMKFLKDQTNKVMGGATRSTSEFDIPGTAAANPIREGLDKKGAETMTFNTELGTAVNPKKKRQELFDSFYRMNPGIKRQSILE